MKILFLTDNFPPETNAPANRTFEHCREWVREGATVKVITCAPNFPEGKVFEGYTNSLYKREMMEGISVARVKTYIAENKGFLKRTLDHVSFMMGAILAAPFQGRPDVIVATSPQFFTLLAGVATKYLMRRPLVLEIRDLWPDSIVAVGAMKESAAIKFLRVLERFAYRSSDKIIVVTESFKKELVERGIPASKVDVVFNGVDRDKFQTTADSFRKELNLEGKKVFGYLGTIGMAHNIELLVDVAERVKDDPTIHILIAGAGAAYEPLEQKVKESGLTNISLIPRQTRDKMPALWSTLDVSLVILRDRDIFRTVLPSKIFESMAMGKPILIAVPEGEATEMVRRTTSGVITHPDNADAIADEVRRMSAPSFDYVSYVNQCKTAAGLYDRKTLARKMLTILKAMVGKSEEVAVKKAA